MGNKEVSWEDLKCPLSVTSSDGLLIIIIMIIYIISDPHDSTYTEL